MRPSIYTQELADRICTWIAEGKSLHAFCREPDTPSRSTIMLWVVTKDEFLDQYRNARQAGGFSHADDIAMIAEKVLEGEIEPGAAKVIIDARKWTAERMAPKHHMPQSLVNVESPNGTMTPPAVVELVAKPTPEDEGTD